MSTPIIFAIGVVTVVLMSVFVYVTVHEITKPEPPMVPLDEQLGELHVFTPNRSVLAMNPRTRSAPGPCAATITGSPV